MYFTIAQASQKTGLSLHTIRYYDKEGLLPFVERTTGGIRRFKESDFEWLSLIACLKDTGMQIKQIKIFIDWYLEGDVSLKQRYNVFVEQKEKVEKQIRLLNKHLEKINHKIWYYEVALKAGTEKIHTKKNVIGEI